MSQLYEPNAKKKLVATIVCIAVIAIVVVLFDQTKTKTTTAATTQIIDTPSATATAMPTGTTTTSTPVASATPAPTAAASSGSYKNGTYTASSSYEVPHGSEDIQVSVTLKDGVITASSVQNSENDHDSARYQEDFTSVYKSSVIGKNISDLQIDVVAGASDTTDGFNDALSQIASQAKA